MGDRDASFFGPVLPQEAHSPEAFTFDELQQIRGRRIEADLKRAGPQVWAECRRPTMYPVPFASTSVPGPVNGGGPGARASMS